MKLRFGLQARFLVVMAAMLGVVLLVLLLLLQRQEARGTEELCQRVARLRVAGRLQQDLAQAFPHLRPQVAAGQFQRTRIRGGLVDHPEIALEGVREPAVILPVQAADRAGIGQALVHPGRDVALRSHQHVAHPLRGRLVGRAQQDLRRQPGIEQGGQGHHVGTGGGGALQGQGPSAQVFQRLDRAVPAHEEHRVVAAHAVALGQQDRLGPGTLFQLHRGAGRFGHPVDPVTTQVAGHQLGVTRHQDPALGDPDLAHARHHVVQQRLELGVVGAGIIADAAQHQDMAVLGGLHRPGRDHGDDPECRPDPLARSGKHDAPINPG